MSLRFPYSSKPSLLGALIRNESGGRNITQGEIGDINNRTGDLAKGYFQITGSTWHDFGGDRYTSDPLKATWQQQFDIARRIPLSRWGPGTIAAMRATGRPINTKMSLGENLAMNGVGSGDPPPATTAAAPAADSSAPPSGLFTPASTELTKAEDKKQSLGGLLGQINEPVQNPLEMQNLMPQQPGGAAQQPSLAELIQQYMQTQIRGRGPPGGGPVITPQGGSPLG